MAATIQSCRAPCWSSPSASLWSTWPWTCCTPSWIHGSPMPDELRRLRANRLTVIGTMLTLFIVALALLANQVAPYDPLVLNARHRLEGPRRQFRFGTDRLGRDPL